MADVLLIAIRSGPNRWHSGLDHELILAVSFAGTELDIAARWFFNEFILYVIRAGAYLEVVALYLAGHDQALHTGIQETLYKNVDKDNLP
jgi:hypothetical protein